MNDDQMSFWNDDDMKAARSSGFWLGAISTVGIIAAMVGAVFLFGWAEVINYVP